MPTPADKDELDDALAEARPADPAGVALVRARVASVLFGSAATLGRFHVLERLGKGGMGVVYAAYDPELDRKVALKMVSVPAGGRDAALAEAKALAKLSHPNIVPVFDVGIVDEHVYIVMELVRGNTLREWVAGKSVREIVDAYRQAGSALAAAHAEKLVHRDVKPDNAIVGDDGRVRVVDFGLACEAASQPRKTGGTPKYMAPELATGGAITPAADQYSFSVSLVEALGETPPGWIAAITDRGRAAEPADRFASMDEVVRALGRDPARVWRRRGVAVGALALAGVAFIVGRSGGTAREDDRCSGDGELAGTWQPARVAEIAALSPYGAELAPRASTAVATFSSAWLASYRSACLGGAMVDRRMACLDRARTALATVGEIAATATAGNLGDLARGLAALPDPARCSDLVALSADVAPPPTALEPALAPHRADLERARVQLAAGRASVAHDLASRAVTALRGLAYPPLVAEALLVDGHALMASDPRQASARLREATSTGLAANVDPLAVEAWARRAWLDGLADEPEALAGLDIIDGVAARTPSAAFARALLLNNVGSVLLARGNRDGARASFSQALGIAQGVTGPGAVELVAVRRNLARVTDDLDQRAALLAAANRELARLLGPAHPDVLMGEMIRAGAAVTSSREAARELATTCPQMAQHDRLAPEMRACFAELAFVDDDLGDAPAAIAAIDRAVAAADSDNVGAPEVAAMAKLLHGDAAGALTAATAALANAPLEPNQPPHRRLDHARVRLTEGLALRALGKLDRARASFAIVVELLAGDEAHATAATRRRLARARAELARVTAAAAPGSGSP